MVKSALCAGEMRSVPHPAKQDLTAKRFHPAKRDFTRPQDGFRCKNPMLSHWVFAVPVVGLDLPCGAGRVAGQTCHRHSVEKALKTMCPHKCGRIRRSELFRLFPRKSLLSWNTQKHRSRSSPNLFITTKGGPTRGLWGPHKSLWLLWGKGRLTLTDGWSPACGAPSSSGLV